jgi:hypothetical protein
LVVGGWEAISMTDAGQILAFLVGRIGSVYLRPRMYGGDAAGVQAVLGTYHDVWAEVAGRRDDFERAVVAVNVARGHGAMSADGYFRAHAPGGRGATEEAVAYVVAYWKAVDAALGLDATGGIGSS